MTAKGSPFSAFSLLPFAPGTLANAVFNTQEFYKLGLMRFSHRRSLLTITAEGKKTGTIFPTPLFWPHFPSGNCVPL